MDTQLSFHVSILGSHSNDIPGTYDGTYMVFLEVQVLFSRVLTSDGVGAGFKIAPQGVPPSTTIPRSLVCS